METSKKSKKKQKIIKLMIAGTFFPVTFSPFNVPKVTLLLHLLIQNKALVLLCHYYLYQRFPTKNTAKKETKAIIFLPSPFNIDFPSIRNYVGLFSKAEIMQGGAYY